LRLHEAALSTLPEPTDVLKERVSRIRRYPVVAVLVAAALLVGVSAGIAAVNPTPSLPSIGAQELINSTVGALAQDPALSGRLLSHVDLGIPSLPGQAPQSDQPQERLFEAINGDHRIRYWNSADGIRISELLPTAELSFIARRSSGSAEAWAWDSRSFTALHLGPAPVPGKGELPPSPAALFDPMQATRQVLAAIAPTTAISLAPPAKVAGRDAYVLRIEPRTAETLIGRIEVSVDAERRIPLRVAVFARGAGKAALSLGYTSIRFGTVDPSVFTFEPPPGAKVTQVRPPSADHAATGASGAPENPSEYVRTFGTAWTTVVAYRLPPESLKATGGQFDLGALLPFNGALFSARLAERPGGPWLMVGAVPQSRLADLESQLP
jgi:hypothetical protein